MNRRSASNDSMQCMLELCYTSCKLSQDPDDNEEQCVENSRGRGHSRSADSVCAQHRANWSPAVQCAKRRPSVGIQGPGHLLHRGRKPYHKLSSGRTSTYTQEL